MTDSAIASHLVSDAFLDCFDTAGILGGDTGIVPAVRMVRRHYPDKRIIVYYPPARKNDAVGSECHDSHQITGSHLERAVMPYEINIGNNIVISRPDEWSI